MSLIESGEYCTGACIPLRKASNTGPVILMINLPLQLARNTAQLQAKEASFVQTSPCICYALIFVVVAALIEKKLMARPSAGR